MAPASITEPLRRVLSRFPVRVLVVCSAGGLRRDGLGDAGRHRRRTRAATGRIEGVGPLVAPPGASDSVGRLSDAPRQPPRPRLRNRQRRRLRERRAAHRDALADARADAAGGRSRSCRASWRSRAARRSSFPTPIRSSTTSSRCRAARPSTSGAFRAARAARAPSRSPGLVKVYCHLHSHMSASIMVFDHPHFVVPRGDGAASRSPMCRPANTASAPGTSASAKARRPSSSKRDAPSRIEFALPVETE